MPKMTIDEIRKMKGQTDWDRIQETPDHEGEQEIDVDWSSARMVQPKKEALIDLLAKVDAGTAGYQDFSACFINGDPSDDACVERTVLASRAFRGDRNAAVLFHEAVLPGWSWGMRASGLGSAQAAVWDTLRSRDDEEMIRRNNPCPARALLIADIEALIVKEG